MRGPGRGLEGLLWDVAEAINRRKEGRLSRRGGQRSKKLTPQGVEAMRILYKSTLHLSQKHPDRWTGRRLAEAFRISVPYAMAIVAGRQINFG